jgi:hypothetical protein
MGNGVGRFRARIVGPMTIGLGAAITGAVFSGLVAFIGASIGLGLPRSLLAGMLSLGALAWYARGHYPIPWGRAGVQANRDLASRRRAGLLYFGGVLGPGILTVMSTPLVWVGVAFCLAGGVVWGVLYGMSFGFGRSVLGLVVASIKGRDLDAGQLTDHVLGMKSRVRWVGLATAVACVGLAVGTMSAL